MEPPLISIPCEFVTQYNPGFNVSAPPVHLILSYIPGSRVASPLFGTARLGKPEQSGSLTIVE